jgi:hypothetical protein
MIGLVFSALSWMPQNKGAESRIAEEDLIALARATLGFQNSEKGKDIVAKLLGASDQVKLHEFYLQNASEEILTGNGETGLVFTE